MGFMDDKYLLESEVSLAIYSSVKNLPVIDPHNHADVKEIAENKNYSDAWQVFAATDHYVWEVMRKRGVEEKYITGNASPKVQQALLRALRLLQPHRFRILQLRNPFRLK